MSGAPALSRTATPDRPARDVAFRPIDAQRGFEEVASQIRAAMVSGELRPGDRLPSTRDLAGAFGVSRALVNEAIRVLEHAGVLESRPGARGGTIIRRPGSDPLTSQLGLMIRLGGVKLVDLTEYRLVVEGQNAEWAARRATDDDIQELRAIIGAAADIRRSGVADREGVDPRIFKDVDVRFHVAVAKAAHNEFSEAIVRGTIPAIREIIDRLPEQLPGPDAEVPDCVEAIAARRPEAARKAMQAHIAKFAELAALADARLRG
jgi:DNA-binding FadR family transcriptional regulator